MQYRVPPETGTIAWLLVIVAGLLETGLGIGAAGTVVFGMLFLDESSSPVKVLSVSLIVAGVVGLNLSGATH